MADAKRDRQRQARQAKLAAELAAKKRAARKRQMIFGGVIFAVLAAVVLIVNRDDGKKTPVAASKPCVARTDALPANAPDVPVKVGAQPTSLVSEDLALGTGATAVAGSTVTVNYIGVACTTGVIFDSSYSHDPPAPSTFALSSVIAGWQQGIPGMNVGGKRLLGIPADLAYKAAGRPPDIGPNEPLWFVIELLETQPTG